MATITKTNGQLMDWSLLDDTAANPFLETNEIGSNESLDSCLDCILHIDMCHYDDNEADDPAYCEVMIKSGATDEDWHSLITFQATGGTAGKQNLDATSGSGEANPERIYVGSTTNFETVGDKYWLRRAADITESCIVINKYFANDDYIVAMDNLVNTYYSTDPIYNIVDQWNVRLPREVQAAKVIFYNTDSNARYACRVRYNMSNSIS